MSVILPWQHIVCCTVDPPSSDRLREPLKTRKVMETSEIGDKKSSAKGGASQMDNFCESNFANDKAGRAHLYNSPLSTPRHLVPLFLELRRLAKVAPLPLRLVLRAVEPINRFHRMRILSVGLRPSPRILGNHRGIIQHSGFGAAPQLKIALL